MTNLVSHNGEANPSCGRRKAEGVKPPSSAAGQFPSTKMTRKYKSVEELTIRDNFMFVKVFSDEEIAKPFLRALLKIDIEKITIVGEAHLQTDPSKKYIRFDVMAKEEGAEGVGRVFDLEMQMVDRGELPKRAHIFQSKSYWFQVNSLQLQH